MAKLSSAELAKREDIIKTMKKNKRGLVKRYGSDAEKVMYGRATNIAKKVAETQMEKSNLKELVRAALMQEKAGFSKEFDSDPALKGGQKNLPDGLQKAIISKAKPANEDLDLGHEDDEPHMIKGELYRIGKYAMELYQMVDGFEEMGGEIDFPAWWQAKITTAMNNMVSAKHYLDFETKEPEIDAAVDVIDASNALDNVGVDEIKESLNEDLTSALTALIISIIAIPALPITGALIMGLIDYIFNELPEQRAEAKSLRSYKGPDKQEKVLALAKEIESKLSPGKKRYLKTLVDRIGASKLEDKAKEYRELDRYVQRQKLDENLATDIEAALKDLPVPNVGINEATKMYYHVIEDVDGEKGWQGAYDTQEEAEKRADKLQDMFPRSFFYVEAYDSASEPYNITLEEGLPKGYFKKATAELDESFEKLVGKLKKGGKSEKAAKAIAGAVASYKAKGGGKGPTAKQKARG